MTPTVGRIVHYVSYGTPGGEYGKENRAAVVTAVGDMQNDAGYTVSLAVMNPTGMFFNTNVLQDQNGRAGGTWHWPDRESN